MKKYGRKGKIYQREGYNTWYIQYWFHGRRIRKAVSENKYLAEAALAKKNTEIAEEKHLDIKKEAKIKFSDFVQEYLNGYAKAKRSYVKDVQGVKILNNIFGFKYLHEITQFDVIKFKTQRSQEVSGASTNRNLALLKCIFNQAIAANKFTGKNPVKGVKLFKEQARLRFLEKEEIDALLANCTEHLKPIVTVALNTGMRKGEILNLKWHDLDFKRDSISLYNTKNGEKREVPMNEQAKSTLIKVKKHVDSQYIFCKKDGKPYGDIKKSFLTALNKSGILEFHFHDLRHTFASHLVMNGVDLNTVRELLGHKKLDMTLRYSHLSPDHKKRAVDLLGQKIGLKSGTNCGTLSKGVENNETPVFDNALENKELAHIWGP